MISRGRALGGFEGDNDAAPGSTWAPFSVCSFILACGVGLSSLALCRSNATASGARDFPRAQRELMMPAADAPSPADNEVPVRSAQVGVTHLEEASAAGWVKPWRQEVGECITDCRGHSVDLHTRNH